jgi:hypothetical protein
MQIAWSNTGNDRNDDGIFPSTALALQAVARSLV